MGYNLTGKIRSICRKNRKRKYTKEEMFKQTFEYILVYKQKRENNDNEGLK